MSNGKGFTFFENYYKSISDEANGLTLEEQGELYNAIFAYIFDAKEPSLKGACRMAFNLLRPSLDVSRTRAEAGSKKKNVQAKEAFDSDTSESGEKQNESNENQNENKKNQKENKTEQTEIKIYETETETETYPPLNPPLRVGAEPEGEKEKFFSLYPKLKASKKYNDRGVDYKILLDRFSVSQYLRGTYSMRWVCENYEAIKSGTYTDPESVSDQKAARERYYSALREKAESAAERAEAQALHNPEYKQLASELSEAERESAKAEAFGLDALPALLEKIESLKRKRYALMNKMGISEKDLMPQYACKKCSDTGFLPDGRACDCYKQ